MTQRSLWLIAYDVREPRRLRRTLEVVKSWSTGGQKSLHECWLDDAELVALAADLRAEIDPRIDSLLLLAPEPKAGVRTLGIATKPIDPHFFYLG